MPTKKLSVFETLSKIDVSNHVETIKMRKGPALKYVSWAWAWAMVKSKYPDAQRKIEEYPEYQYDKGTGKWYATGQMLDYRVTPAGCEVKVTVTIAGEEYSERLYVMDMRNQPVPNPNISQINKTQQRCLVKALAMAGLGLNLYAGEDLPMGDISEEDEKANERKKKANERKKKAETKAKAQAEKARAEALKEAQKAYNERLSKTAEVVGQDTKTIEDGVKATAKEQIPNFNDWDELHQKSKLIDILDRILEKHHATEQGQLEEV